MIAVIAAMLFIGIVTASMLKNTGSLSRSSVAYGNMAVMNSTVRSGMIATESYLANTANSDVYLAKMSAALNAKDIADAAETVKKPFIFGGGSKEQLGSSNQFFNVRIVNVDDHVTRIVTQIGSGKKAAGKDIKRALAFYHVGNVIVTPKTPPPITDWPGKNAMYLGGNFAAGNAPMTLRGYATFMKTFDYNPSLTTDSVFFVADNGNGDVYFHENFRSVTPNMSFNTKTYFNQNAAFNFSTTGSYNMFKADVGFNGNFSMGTGKTADFSGDVYMNGGIKDEYGGTQSTSLSGTGSTIHYNTAGFNLEDACKNGTCTHNPPTTPHKILNSSGNVGMTLDKKDAAMNIPGIMGISTGTAREEPTLNWRQITEPPHNKEFLSFRNDLNGSNVSMDILNSWYETYPKDEYPRYYYTDAQDRDHLLVNVDASFTGNFNGASFNNNIIFVVGGDFGGDLYSGGNTMIFADPGAKLSLKLKGDTVFDGLIYVDPNNSEAHTVNPDPSYPGNYTFSVSGAIISKGTNATWSLNPGGAIDVIRDENVLNAFTGFINGNTGGSSEVETSLEDESKGMLLKPMGYYFY